MNMMQRLAPLIALNDYLNHRDYDYRDDPNLAQSWRGGRCFSSSWSTDMSKSVLDCDNRWYGWSYWMSALSSSAIEASNMVRVLAALTAAGGNDAQAQWGSGGLELLRPDGWTMERTAEVIRRAFPDARRTEFFKRDGSNCMFVRWQYAEDPESADPYGWLPLDEYREQPEEIRGSGRAPKIVDWKNWNMARRSV
jgi:hypothetical protein